MTADPAASPIPGLISLLRGRLPEGSQSAADAVSEGLRDRKKRLTRQRISDTATAMFLERGFEDVRVAEVAAACDVSEKTVYNYFPSKESLMLDREESMSEAIARALGPGAEASPIDAVVGLLVDEMRHLVAELDEAEDQSADIGMVRRFVELVDETPSLRAAYGDMMERMVEVAAGAMAARAGVDPEDPEPQIAADALIGLWRVGYRATRRYADGTMTPSVVAERVITEVRRAARLIDTGLWSFDMAVQGNNGREQLRVAAESANEARKQVVTAIRQARAAWRQVMADGPGGEWEHARSARHQAHHDARRARRR